MAEAEEPQETGISGLSETPEYVSLPVTIRDFAADGMLFEFNQTGITSGNYTAYKVYDYLTASAQSGFYWGSNSNLGFRVRPYSVYKADPPDSYDWWYCIICNSDGSIKKIMPAGDKSLQTKAEYGTYMTEGCFSVWLWIADDTTVARAEQREIYNELVELVNEKTQQNFRFAYDSNGKLSLKAEYANIGGKNYFLGDNNGFTLLSTNDNQYVHNLTGDASIAGTQVVQNDGSESVSVTLNSGAPQTIEGGNMRLNLVTEALDKDGKPVYTQATVDYLADLLYTMLRVDYEVKVGDDTYYPAYYLLGTKLYDENYNYVDKHSADAKYDLADVFRGHIYGGMGTYAEAKAKFEAGGLSVPQEVYTYYDAAYYLLHNVWRDSPDEGHSGNDGYGWNTWNYNKINLIQTTNEAGQKCYVFNSGYDGTKYDPMGVVDDKIVGSGAIYNTQVETMTPAKNPSDGSDVYNNGIVLPNARFDPLGTSGTGQSFGYGQNAGTYCDLLNTFPDRGRDFYPNTNYHLTLEGHAKFIYYKDAAQYFTFTGDDDVYLYINGIRVLDLGGAHSIAKVKINMNDIAELCGLKDGNTYTFDFFYMERHGTAANFGIETNIQIVDPSMLTTKTGYQDGENTGYNGFVDPEKPVTYEFTLANNGDADIENLTFDDQTIGVKLTKDEIVLNSLTEIGDLSVSWYEVGEEGDTLIDSVAAGSLTKEDLKSYLAKGLLVGEKIVIHGFNYLIQDGDWDCRYVDENKNGIFDDGDDRTSNWYFFNVVYTTATAEGENSTTRELTGTSNWVVQKEGEGGPVTDKTVAGTNDPNAFELTLEAYALGQTQTTTVEKAKPTDIVLVLDQSASMYAPAGAEADYDNLTLLDPETMDSDLEYTALDTDKAAHRGYYVAQSHSGRKVKDADGNESLVYDWFVVQYINGKWYYVRKDKTAMPAELDVNYSGSENVVGATLVRDNAIETFYYYQSGYGELYDSVCDFVDGVKNSGVDHRIAVVGFASSCYDAMTFFDGSGVYLDGEYYRYDTEYLRDDGGIYTYTYLEGLSSKRYLTDAEVAALPTANAASVYDRALVPVSTGYDSIMASVNAVTTNYWHTCPAAGLDMANQIFGHNDNVNADGTERDRIVILFTDGVPTMRLGASYEKGRDYTNRMEDGLYVSHHYWTVASGKDSAMEQAYITKNIYGAKLHAVGTAAVGGDPFLNGVSSDYPDAQAYPYYYTDANGTNIAYEDHMTPPTEAEIRALMGASITVPKYAHITADDKDLGDIFDKILESTTTVSVGADENSVLREVLTDYFVLQNNSEVDVDVYTAVYNGDGTYAEAEKREDLTVTLSSSEGTDRLDTIDVTGYDYRDEYISSVVRYKDGQPYYGSKLILKVRIKTRDGFWGGNNVPTNEPTTGIYDEQGEELSKFPEPQVNVPLSLTITAKDAVVYYGSDDLDAGLVDAITAGGLGVTIGENGSLLPQADWMNDYAQLNWTEGLTKPGDDLSSTADGSYTYGVTLTPIYDGKENNSENPSNMAGTPVDVTGMSAKDDANVEILVPVVYFQDSTLQQGEKPDADYFKDHNQVEGVQWVLMTTPDTTKPATHGSAPELSYTYHHTGIFEEATPINVTVKGTYGTNAPIEMTEVSYFDWVECKENLHDDAEGTIERHLGGTVGQNEFWIHVPEGVSVGGLVTDKYVEATDDPNEFVLTLEAYSKGVLQQITKPADIVLVLDHSGSMRTPVGATEIQYSPEVKDGVTIREGKLFTDGTEIPRSQISVAKAKHRGYYVAQSKETLNWFVMEYDVDFQLDNGTTAERWVGYLVPSTESIVDTTSGNYTEHKQVLSWVPGSVDANLIFYKSQYAVLYDSLLEFVEDLKDSGAEHNVSIVGFAGSQTQGSRLYVGGGEDMVKTYDAMYNKSTEERRTELYQKAPKNVQDTAEYAELLKVIESIETNFSYTCPTAGLQMASDLFKANEVSLADRDRIVVLFTDGIPNRKLGEDTEIVEEEGRQDAIYDEIVKKAYETKNTYGAQVYSICTTTLKAGENGENRTFLNYASSNYPNAAAYSNPGSAASTQYYHEIKDFETLSNVFKTVTQSTTSVTLDEQAALKEVLTDYFVLNPDDTVDVEIYTAAYNGDGTFAEPKLRTEADGYKYALSSSEGTDRMDTISVTGFDYANEYISNTARTVDNAPYYGSKLVVKVRIRTRNGFWGGNNVPTNEDSTAIYNPEGKPVIGFPEPEVNVPADVEVIAKDKTVYYGDEPTAKELLDKVTAGGVDVTINDDGTFTPKEPWMDDFSNLSWTEPSTKPSDDASGTTPDDYTFEVVLKPNAPATDNTNDPGNIAGDPVDPAGKTDSDTGHVFVLVPEVTFKDSVTEFGTPTNGYDYTKNDYVSTEWVNMETNLPEGTVVPDPETEAPDLTLIYTPEDNATEFVGDTKVEVTVSRADKPGVEIDKVTDFKWNDCEHPDEHGNCGAIGEHKANAENVHEFWVHTVIKIVPDTVVIDYGLDVVIDVLSNDPKTENIKPKLTGIGAQKADSFDTDAVSGKFGKLTIDGSDSSKVRYALSTENGMQINKEEVFAYEATYTIKGKDTALSETVTVIPATIIYYEDEFVQYSVWDASTFKKTDEDWESVGKAVSQDQAQDRPEKNLSDVDADNIYGYDGAYTNMATYSLGSAKKVTVDKDKFAEAQFTFYGTGFDIISLTSNMTGTILVDVYKTEDFKTDTGDNYNATSVASYMVDTYYGYKYALCNVTYLGKADENGNLYWERNVDSLAEGATEEDPAEMPELALGAEVSGIEFAWIVDSTASDSLYQVPVMKVSGLTYDRYTALITVSYMEGLDHQKADDSYDFYLDAIRIYDPANDGKGNATIENAYKADGEGWPEYFELRNLIISEDDFYSLDEETGKGIVFIDNTLDTNYKTTYTISDYTSFGPNNEVYLAPKQAVAFELDVDDPDLAAIHLAMKSVGNTAKVAVYAADDPDQTSVTPTEIKTATDLYYDITSLNHKTVVITNTGEPGEAILSITNVKVTYNSEHPDSIENSYFKTSQDGAEAAIISLVTMHTPADPDVPEVTEPEVTEPEVTEPEETEPEVTEPEETEPEVTEPEETEPEVTEPEVTEPEVTEPEETEPEEPEPDVFTPGKFTVSVSDSRPSEDSLVLVTVTTSADVHHITVNGKKITMYAPVWFTRTRVWSTWVVARDVGEMDVDVICYNADDLASETVTKTLMVTEKSLLGKILDLIGNLLKP